MKNFGIKEGQQEKVGDYKANEVVGNLPYEIRVPDGNWRPWLPEGENQWNDDGDSKNCTSFGTTNTVEIQVKFHTGKEENYSDRELGVRAGNQIDGNWLYKPVDATRNGGLCLESTYPPPANPWDWEKYHELIPEALKPQIQKERKEFLEKWDVKREWISVDKASMKKHLKHAPLAVIIPGHAVAEFLIDENDIDHYFDSYAPYEKTVGPNRKITYAMKIVVTPIEKSDHPDSLFVDLKLGDSGSQISRLLRALRLFGWGRDMTESWSPVYDYKVADLVMKFKLGNVHDGAWERFWERYFYRGVRVNVKMRNIVNKMLKNHR